MPTFKYTEIPPFTKRDGDSLLFNQDGVLEYYIPEDYIGTSDKASSMVSEGAYIKLTGSFNYRIIDVKGKLGKLMTFNFASMFLCRPGKVETRKNIKLDEHLDESNYMVLSFFKGDQLITHCHVGQNIDNVSELFRLHIRTGNIPNSIPYTMLYQYPTESMELNGDSLGLHSQLVGLAYSKICRDPDDVSVPFRLSKAINKKMTGYTPISIKEAAKYISPFASLISENLDDSIVSSVILSDEEKTGKRKHQESPMERIMMM